MHYPTKGSRERGSSRHERDRETDRRSEPDRERMSSRSDRGERASREKDREREREREKERIKEREREKERKEREDAEKQRSRSRDHDSGSSLRLERNSARADISGDKCRLSERCVISELDFLIRPSTQHHPRELRLGQVLLHPCFVR